jgi:hypothetical protein
MPQDTRPGEGMQVTTITTSRFSGDILVMNAEACGKNYKGGFMLYDVTNPLKPVKLKEGFGDRTGSDRGVGLGLSIVKTVVTTHGGEVSARALEAGGLEVRVTLPRCNPARPGPEGEALEVRRPG